MNRSLSRATLASIEQIFGDQSIWGRPARLESTVELVRFVAAQNEPFAAPGLLPLAFVADPHIADAAAHAIHHLVSLVPPGELRWLDEHVRRRYPTYAGFGSRWFEIGAREVSRSSGFGAASVSLLGLASFHGSGFIRQKAVELLSGLTGGAELSFLLLRLNDWVGIVRDTAHAAVRARLVAEYAPHFARNLDLVTRLARASRATHQEFIDEVFTILRAPEGREALLGLLRSPDRQQRRLAYRLLLEAQHDPPWLVRGAVEDVDPAIRLWAIDRATEVLQGASLADLFTAALRDPVPRVRSHALSGLQHRYPEIAARHARAVLLDLSATLRQQARLILRPSGRTYLAAFYRTLLAHELTARVRQAALLGLGEVGTPEDAHVLSGCAADPVPRVRAAVLWALERLTAAENVSAFLNALGDPSPRVSRQAARCLSAYLTRIEPETLQRAFRATDQPHTKRNVLRLIAKSRKWDSLPMLLQALADRGAGVRELAVAYLRRWVAQFNRRPSLPRAEQLASSRALLESHRFLLSGHLYRELEFMTRE